MIWVLNSAGIVRLVSGDIVPVEIITIPERHKSLEPPPPMRLRLAAGLSNRELAASINVPLPMINIEVPTEAPVATTSNPSSGVSSHEAGLGLGAGHGFGTAISTPPKKSDVQIVLTQRLSPTGVQLAKGQRILITARGTMNYYTGACSGCTSEIWGVTRRTG